PVTCLEAPPHEIADVGNARRRGVGIGLERKGPLRRLHDDDAAHRLRRGRRRPEPRRQEEYEEKATAERAEYAENSLLRGLCDLRGCFSGHRFDSRSTPTRGQ